MENTIIIKGSVIAEKVKLEISEKLQDPLFRNLSAPMLTVITYDNDEASKVYVRQKKRACEELGIIFNEIVLNEEKHDEKYLLKVIDKLNLNTHVTGILVQLPLPKSIDEKKILNRISPRKDVDGFTSINAGNLALGLDCLKPCTPKGIIRMLKEIGYDDLSGLDAVVIGRSNIVGKPIAQMLLQKNATVTVCHTKTKDIKLKTANADIIIVAAGVPKLVDASYIGNNRPIVIDVGIHRTDNGLVGDVDFDSIKDLCKAISPVPRGVGPMTVAMLMENIYEAYEMESKLLWKYNQSSTINNAQYNDNEITTAQNLLYDTKELKLKK